MKNSLKIVLPLLLLSYTSSAQEGEVPSALSGYTFVGWYIKDAEVSRSPSYTFTVNGEATLEAKSLEAKFVANVYYITSSGNHSYGSDIAVKATPSSGYILDGWYEAGKKVSGSETYNFTVTANRTEH